VRSGIGMLFGLISLAIGTYGVWLIATLESEFEPRGAVGVLCVGAAVGFAATSWLALRRR